ncbi:MAG: glucose-6-phosphate isomerase, partial [Actinomycetota bacterium]|nr:glucose-6-phosphate isomerase [Actinomycetota bacterium]
RLGWLDVAARSAGLVPQLVALRAELLAEDLDRVVLCGMGGSSLAPEVICRGAGVDLVVLDSTHPDQVRAALADLPRTVVVVSSKSGKTLETDSQRRSFVAAFEAAGIDPRRRIVVVTDPGSDLEQLARDEGYREVFLADPHVGGRYSALTAFGLVPSALAGADVELLLRQAEPVLANLGNDDCPGLALGAALGGVGRDKVALDGSGSDLPGFGDWAEQLIAESTGKEGRGLLPVVVEAGPEVRWPADDVHVVRLADPAPELGTLVTGELGEQFITWIYGVAVAGRLLGINPFDQPDVESAKTAARALLDQTPAAEPVAFVEGSVEVRGTAGLLEGVTTLAGAVDALLSLLPKDGYLALMAYLDRHRDSALACVREPLCRRTQRPVTFGWGPRFLHSTGQFHKGGTPVGVFLQVTGLVEEDLAIPDRPFTYGDLIASQAAGDAQVLAQHGRPVLRLHLTSSDGLKQVLEALQ